MSAGGTGGPGPVAPAATSVLRARRHPLPDPVQPEAGQAAPRPYRVARRVGVATRWLSNLVAVVAFAAFLGLAVGPHLFGYRTMTMLTGSMVPVIDPGDVVVDTEVPVHRLNVGDIITYRIPVDDHRIVSHRIMSIRTQPDGSVVIQTKGDANPGPDPWQSVVTAGKVYQVRMVVPKVGSVIRVLRRPDLEHGLRFGGIGAFVLLFMMTIWSRDPAGKSRPKPGGTADDAGAARSIDDIALILLHEKVREPAPEPAPVGEPGPGLRHPPPVPAPRRPSGWENLNRRLPGGLAGRPGEYAGTRR